MSNDYTELMTVMHHDSFLAIEMDCEGFILRYRDRRGVRKELRAPFFDDLLEKFCKLTDRHSIVPHDERIEWISVHDELPDADISVLISNTTREPWIGFYDYESQCWRHADASCCSGTVTHWAHLPKGPE